MLLEAQNRFTQIAIGKPADGWFQGVASRGPACASHESAMCVAIAGFLGVLVGGAFVTFSIEMMPANPDGEDRGFGHQELDRV